MRAFSSALLFLAVWSPIATSQQPHFVDAVVIEGLASESPSVTPLEVGQSLNAVRKEIAAAKETYGEESAQVRLLTEILHNLEGTFRQQLAERGMIRTAGHQESAEHEEHEADDEEEEAEEEGEDHAARGGRRRGHNDAAIARLTKQVREMRDEVEKLKQLAARLHEPHSAPPITLRPRFPAQGPQRMRVPDPESEAIASRLQQQQHRIAQLERENAALRQRVGTPAGPRAERVLNALRDQTLQHQAEATKRIEQSFEQMERRLRDLQQRESMERPREERRVEERRIEERRREDRRPRTGDAQPL